jgi:hypothetical protein
MMVAQLAYLGITSRRRRDAAALRTCMPQQVGGPDEVYFYYCGRARSRGASSGMAACIVKNASCCADIAREFCAAVNNNMQQAAANTEISSGRRLSFLLFERACQPTLQYDLSVDATKIFD